MSCVKYKPASVPHKDDDEFRPQTFKVHLFGSSITLTNIRRDHSVFLWVGNNGIPGVPREYQLLLEQLSAVSGESSPEAHRKIAKNAHFR